MEKWISWVKKYDSILFKVMKLYQHHIVYNKILQNQQNNTEKQKTVFLLLYR